MLSRALSLATVTLLVGCLTAGVARAENLDAGKSPSQIFSSTCSACHKSPRGLLKNTPASSLPGFLRQHYTTGSDMASVLSSYLISNGAADPKYQSKDQAKKDARQKDAKQDARPDQPGRFGRRQQPAPAKEASRPDAEPTPQVEGGRRGRDRVARPRATPEAANPPDGQAPPVRAATDSKSDVKQKRGRRAKPATVEEPPKSDAEEPIRIESPKEDVSRDVIKPETSAVDPGKTDAIKRDADKPDSEATNKPAVDSDRPSRDVKSDSTKVDPSSREGVGNDPAPPAAATAPEPDANSAAPSPASPSSVEATAPASPPASSGPPAPPISR
ncbi:hypothetical protein [Bradyrhizobium sp. BWA-3-5]|uniref:hypothetical protein n=1 Tax=Bradyrhizobium sp. BWA-3-5 TaxID=3080013 RepID=UPI00293E5172|nr:hypothetical protein [Bradyrhizobium sp. BWA-3-5]WOH63341.1 hypothetical protein RX331_21675 [Bradyrhizobium sp. BWA-3-5]